MSLMFFFPFDETSRGDFVFLDNFFCFMSLMAVFFDDLLFKFGAISSSLALNCETRVAISAKKSLRIISAMTIFFCIFTFAVDTILHQFRLQNKKYFFLLVLLLYWIRIKCQVKDRLRFQLFLFYFDFRI